MTFELLFPESFVQALLALLAAIALDLILGVAVAVKYKVFDLKKLADFYTTSVIPNLIGWGGADIVLRVAMARVDAQWLSTLTQLGIGTLYVVAIGSLVGSVADKLTKLKAEVPAPAPSVTMTVTLPTATAPAATVSATSSGVTAIDDTGSRLPATPVQTVRKP
mgnify:CR=1 FL=1